MKAILLASILCTPIGAQTFSGTCSVTLPTGKMKQAGFAVHQNQIDPLLTFRIPVDESRPRRANRAFYRYAVQVNYLGGTSFQLSDITQNRFDDESQVLPVAAGDTPTLSQVLYPTPLDKFNANKKDTPLSLTGKTSEFELACHGSVR